jgi:hypothetical protein
VRLRARVFLIATLGLGVSLMAANRRASAASPADSQAQAKNLMAQAAPPMMQQTPQLPPFSPSGPPSPEDEARRRMEKEMAKKANLQRQEQLKRDTDKLLELAKELKQSVDKSNADVLSVDVVRKADEIEKLAHSVKQKMKNE